MSVPQVGKGQGSKADPSANTKWHIHTETMKMKTSQEGKEIVNRIKGITVFLEVYEKVANHICNLADIFPVSINHEINDHKNKCPI